MCPAVPAQRGPPARAEGSPQAAHSPNPFMAESSSPAATFSPRCVQPVARSDEPRHSRGSSPDRDGEIPAPRSVLPAEPGWGLCVLGRELCGGAPGLGAVCAGEHLLGLGAVCVCVLGAGSIGGGGVLSGGVGSRAGLHLCVCTERGLLCVSVCRAVDGAGEPQLRLPDGPAAGERHSRCRHLCFEPCLSSFRSLAQSQWQLGPSVPLCGFPLRPASP